VIYSEMARGRWADTL